MAGQTRINPGCPSSRSKALLAERRGNGACQTCSNASVPRTKEQSEVVIGSASRGRPMSTAAPSRARNGGTDSNQSWMPYAKALLAERRGNGACQTCSNASVPRTKEQSEVVVGRSQALLISGCHRISQSGTAHVHSSSFEGAEWRDLKCICPTYQRTVGGGGRKKETDNSLSLRTLTFFLPRRSANSALERLEARRSSSAAVIGSASRGRPMSTTLTLCQARPLAPAISLRLRA
jgi:hypothetical protein